MTGYMMLKLLEENNNTNDDICYYPVANLAEEIDFNSLKLHDKIHVFTRGSKQSKKLFQLMSIELFKSQV